MENWARNQDGTQSAINLRLHKVKGKVQKLLYLLVETTVYPTILCCLFTHHAAAWQDCIGTYIAIYIKQF